MKRTSSLTLAVFTFVVAMCAAIGDPAHSALAKEPTNVSTKPVPFKLAKPDKPLILLETMANGQGPFRFVLDTGAGMTIITPELAKRLDVKQGDADQALGAGGSVDVRFGELKTLAVGDTRKEGLKVGIMDLTGISKAIETDIDGIVGYNFLHTFRVLIDYPKQTVTFE